MLTDARNAVQYWLVGTFNIVQFSVLVNTILYGRSDILRKRVFTDFGRSVVSRLMELGMTQEDLIAEVKKCSGLFVDSSYLYKLLTGQRKAEKVADAIRAVLSLPS